MSASTRLVWDLAGRPDAVGPPARLLADVDGVCCVCGQEEARTAPTGKALGTNFTDRSMFRERTDRVCEACLWAVGGRGRATLRLWTVVAAPGRDLPASHEAAHLSAPGLCLTNRADPAPVARILADPPAGPWAVSVAVSGQKHHLPYAPVNHGRGSWRVRMEATAVTGTPDQWRHVHAHARALRRLGVPAADVRTGTPRYLKTPADLALWRQHATELTPWLGSPLLDLALWCITKGTMQ